MTQVTSPIPPALYVRVGIHNVGDAPIRYDASTLTVEWPGATISDSNLYANGLKTSMGRTFEIETGGELSILYIVWCREAKVAPDTVIIWPGVISSEHKEVVVDSIQYILRSTEE